MPKLLQINADANCGSTGRIAEQINTIARSQGWETYFMYGRDSNPCKSEVVRVGGKCQVIEHYLEHRLFDNDGLASRIATRKMVREIERISPDIIHLHNIHDHWCNYHILFEFLNTLDTPIVWTQHDCWAFTGGCPHFALINCFQWRDDNCSNGCPLKGNAIMRRYFETTNKQFELKRKLFSSTKNLTLVPVSYWLEKLLKQSFLQKKQIVTIRNGVDLVAFHPIDSTYVRNKYGIGSTKYVIGVSSVWLPYKGWNDYLRLARLLPVGIKLVLVGLNRNRLSQALEAGIIGIPKTQSQQELAGLYSGAEIVMNLSYQETFGLTSVEGFATGTPAIVYNCTSSPELLTEETGFIVEPGDIDGICNAIQQILSKGKAYYSDACRKRAEQFFNKNDRYMDYIRLYNSLLKKTS